MFSGLPQRLIVDLSPTEVLERLKSHTEPEHNLLPGGDLVEGMKASRRRTLKRVHQLHFISRLTERSFEIEATGKQAGQMGMLKGTITPWKGKSVIDAQFVPNRNVWITYGVALAIGTVGAPLIVPAVVAIVLGVLQYNRLRYGRQVLEAFLPKLFSENAATSDNVVTAKVVNTAPWEQITPSAETIPQPAPRKSPPIKPDGSKTSVSPARTTRTFSDRSGKFQLKAELLDLDHRHGPAKVLLRDEQGTTQSIGLEQLCEADQRWVLHEMRYRMQPTIAANKKLARKRVGIILAVFLGMFLLTFAAMGCLLFIPLFEVFWEVQR